MKNLPAYRSFIVLDNPTWLSASRKMALAMALEAVLILIWPVSAAALTGGLLGYSIWSVYALVCGKRPVKPAKKGTQKSRRRRHEQPTRTERQTNLQRIPTPEPEPVRERESGPELGRELEPEQEPQVQEQVPEPEQIPHTDELDSVHFDDTMDTSVQESKKDI